MKIDIIHTRYSDDGCDFMVFTDGVAAPNMTTPPAIEIHDIDYGRAEDIEKWVSDTDEMEVTNSVQSAEHQIRIDIAQDHGWTP